MRLTDDEITSLKGGKPVQVWRTEEPKHADIGKRYSSGGEEYTVLDVRKYTPNELWTKHRDVYNDLNVKALPGGWPLRSPYAWAVVIVRGDRTDKPRFLQVSGRRSGDYTSDPHRAMAGEPEALSAADLEKFAERAEAERLQKANGQKERRYKKHKRKKKP